MKSILKSLKTFTALAVTAAVFTLANPAKALDQFFTGTSHNGATNLATVIIPALSDYQPVPHFLNATSDVATAVVKFYRVSREVTITAPSGSATNVFGVSAADAAYFTTTNQIVLVRLIKPGQADVYQRVRNVTQTGNAVKVSEATGSAVARGDKLYICTANGPGLYVGLTATGKEYSNPNGIYGGASGQPLLIEADGTAAAKLFVSGIYRPTQ